MMKEMIIQQHQLVDENMSNLTSASGEASVSSNQQSSFASPNPNPTKKKRNLPGNPDPDAEVIALSPKTLMATNRFVCEICSKGFQRDQNLQLHRRGHNLPWKLKQRSSKEVRKKVYICPEVTCVHHDPSRALGDLTGIKKHFSRKHGEKKWKCDKCSKKYAVQSDWKAHSKICGTREYRCDCGTLFSRRDSFITHRAFCDALAEESARAIAANPLANHHPILFPPPAATHEPSPLQQTILQSQFPKLVRTTEANASNINGHGFQQELSLKREHQHQHFNLRSDMPPWLACQAPISLAHLDLPSSVCSTSLERECSRENPAPHPPLPQAFQAPASSPHMSATALLQKAAEMGATMSRPPHLGQMATHTTNAVAVPNSASGFGLGLSPHQYMNGGGGGSFGIVSPPPPLLHDMVMNSLTSTPGFDGSFDDAFGGMLGSEREPGKSNMESSTRRHGMAEEAGGVGGGNDGKTRDFLGLKAFPHRNILNLTALDPCMSSTPFEHHQQR
ncbi:C2H2 zinc finger protein [Musa troglodytarum]|uniref:Protein EARLY HEADING DATE 2 n=1 Tax=Musa troglodytarum TaxID=320322 RepID=A0A9E7K653_9LILI|nr:C2H2 zinc finger protein [Musa troglodytarum]URE05915.1 C2H2 zinc finger protein [Musa troglodytarum]